MKAIVFGASGFVGKKLIEQLLEDGATVTGISRSDPSLSHKNLTFYKVDITKENDVLSIPGTYDMACNAAAYIPLKMDDSEADRCFMVNTKGTMHVLSFCEKTNITHVVHSSTASVYGVPERVPVTEGFQTHPQNVYAISKLASEHVCHMFSRLHDIKIAILRYSSIYGPGMATNTVLPLFARRIKENKGITLFGKGDRSQDFVYVKDVASANILAAKKKATGIFNIGGGEEVTMKKLAETFIRVMASSSKITYDKSVKENFRMHLDITKAKKEFNFSPAYSLEQGLREYLSPDK